MKNSIRMKLLKSFALLVLLTILLLGAGFSWFIRIFYLETMRERLAEEAQIIGELLKPMLMEQPGASQLADFDNFIENLGLDKKARITMISTTGNVLGDSAVDREVMSNHLSRPEIRGAGESGIGSGIRYSSTLDLEMFYVAVSLTEGGRQLGFVRLAMPLSALNMAMRQVQYVLLAGLLLVLALSMALGYKMSLKLTRPLEQITEAAEHISGGDLESRIYLNREDEIGELAEALNSMAESLQEQLKEISANRDQLEAILSTMMEGIILFDHEGKAVKANPAAERMLGLTSKNWFGRQSLEIVRNVELHEKIVAAHKDMVILEHEVRMIFPERKVLRVNLVPFRPGGQVVNVLAVFHDITRLRRLEDMRADFAANVSHELRTPLTAIRGFSETLLDGAYDDPDVSQRFARIIHREAERLYQLIEELLMLSQIESGKTVIKIEPVSVELLINDVLERMCGQVEKHNVHADVPDCIPPVAGDRGLLSQALYNLLDNAVKYTPPGGSITVAARHRDDSVRISVSDTGIGIPVEAQDRIFERFYRVDRARSRRQGGTGLGLAIVKHIADAHGARLDLESEEGRGTNVTLILPVST